MHFFAFRVTFLPRPPPWGTFCIRPDEFQVVIGTLVGLERCATRSRNPPRPTWRLHPRWSGRRGCHASRRPLRGPAPRLDLSPARARADQHVVADLAQTATSSRRTSVQSGRRSSACFDCECAKLVRIDGCSSFSTSRLHELNEVHAGMEAKSIASRHCRRKIQHPIDPDKLCALRIEQRR